MSSFSEKSENASRGVPPGDARIALGAHPVGDLHRLRRAGRRHLPQDEPPVPIRAEDDHILGHPHRFPVGTRGASSPFAAYRPTRTRPRGRGRPRSRSRGRRATMPGALPPGTGRRSSSRGAGQGGCPPPPRRGAPHAPGGTRSSRFSRTRPGRRRARSPGPMRVLHQRHGGPGERRRGLPDRPDRPGCSRTRWHSRRDTTRVAARRRCLS